MRVRPVRGRGAALAAAAAAIVLIVLAVAVHCHPHGPIARLDVRISDAVNARVWRHPGAIRFWRDVSTVGGPGPCRVAGAVLVVALLLRRRWRPALAAAVTVVLAAAAAPTLKALVDRPRPAPPHPVVTIGGESFPSGHALAAMTFAGIVLLYLRVIVSRRVARVITLIAVLAAVTVGLSRIALGVHYPGDVVGAWLVAVIALWAGTLVAGPSLRSAPP